MVESSRFSCDLLGQGVSRTVPGRYDTVLPGLVNIGIPTWSSTMRDPLVPLFRGGGGTGLAPSWWSAPWPCELTRRHGGVSGSFLSRGYSPSFYRKTGLCGGEGRDLTCRATLMNRLLLTGADPICIRTADIGIGRSPL